LTKKSRYVPNRAQLISRTGKARTNLAPGKSSVLNRLGDALDGIRPLTAAS
jgi:hypothetical protein